MQCPKCKSYSVSTKEGVRSCGVKTCTYVDLHPVSFENDVRHFEGEKGGEDRFSGLFNGSLVNGGIAVDRENNFDKQFRKGQKIVRDICHVLRVQHQKIISTAESRLGSIMRIKAEIAQSSRSDNEEGKRSDEELQSRLFSVKFLACYSIYSACFENGQFFEDYNLAKTLRMPVKDFKKGVQQVNSRLCKLIDFVPTEKQWHHVLRVCRKRNIAREEERAMITLCERIIEAGLQDGHFSKTVAGCVFWKICEHSVRYHNKIRLADICLKYVQAPSKHDSELQMYFDCAQDTIKKFYTAKLEKDFYQKLLPQWEGRLPIRVGQNSNYDNDSKLS